MNYYEEIKKELVNNEIYKRVKDYSKNKSDLSTYYNVGKLLIEAQGGEKRAKYGNGLIKEYSKRLTEELGKGYTITNLKYMRKFYLLCQKGHAVSDQLTWTHYRLLLSIDNINKVDYYVNIGINQNLSVRELQNKIKNNEYERLDDSTKDKLTNKEELLPQDLIKNPILIKNSYNHELISERILKELILEDLDNFLKELGSGFCYIENEYKIKIGNRYNYIDLLLFNIKYNCYVVIELKVTELKKNILDRLICI